MPVATLAHLCVVPDLWRGMMGDDWLNNASTRDTYGRHVESELSREIVAIKRRLTAETRRRDLRYEHRTVVGDPAECLLAYAAEIQPDLIVIGARRPSGVPGLSDAAWVTIDTALSPQALAEFCADVERLFRINPMLEFRAWQWNGPSNAQVSLRNLSNGRDLDSAIAIERLPGAVTVRYATGLKRSTRFEVEPAAEGSRLKIIDDYSGIDPDEARARSDEIDRSLTAWGAALHAYLKNEKRWGRQAWWRWYMRRVWLPMKPAGRRVTYILLVITAVEIAAIALAIAIYRTSAI